ncbi:MAG: hypothetical protein ACRDN9_06260 [Streptosporangiaceae bacterium]
MTTVADVTPVGRLCNAWAAAHTAVAGVPRWARVAAYAIPFTVLPASLWRVAVCTFHAPIADGPIGAGDAPSGVPGVSLGLYVVLLSIVSELAAAAIGLVARWDEVFRDGSPSCAVGACRLWLPWSPLHSARPS